MGTDPRDRRPADEPTTDEETEQTARETSGPEFAEGRHRVHPEGATAGAGGRG